MKLIPLFLLTFAFAQQFPHKLTDDAHTLYTFEETEVVEAATAVAQSPTLKEEAVVWKSELQTVAVLQNYSILQQQDYPNHKVYVFDGQASGNETAAGNTATSELLRIYPNPVDAVLHVENASGSYQLLDIRGQVVASGTLTPQLNLSKLTAGTYILQATVGGTVISKRVVKR